MNKTAIAVHGGAGPLSDFITKNDQHIREGLKQAIFSGVDVLQRNGRATEAVEAAVRVLEDLPWFNAGHGSALNQDGIVQMDAAIMDGSALKAGAVALLERTRNPVTLARWVMENTNHILIAGKSADELYAAAGLLPENPDYFITDHQRQVWTESNPGESIVAQLQRRSHGTVGAVALDSAGNLAAATSTGGLENNMPGRVSDSCIIGAGCYANKECAVSGTGDGEYLMTAVLAHSLSVVLHLHNGDIRKAAEVVIHDINKNVEGDMGLISIDKNGVIGMAYNSERMHRASLDGNGNLFVEVI